MHLRQRPARQQRVAMFALLGDGYAAEVQGDVSLYGSDNVIVEITGAVGLTASNIYVMPYEIG